MKKDVLHYIIVVFIFLFCNYCGSYYYAEEYSFNISCSELIKNINMFMEKYPEYKCTQTNEKGEVYDKGVFYGYSENGKEIYSMTRTENSVFYSFYFHFSDIKADVHCVINVSEQVADTNPSILQLTGVTFSTNWAKWKRINTKELTKKENREIKKKFETEILNNLGKWKHKRWYN